MSDWLYDTTKISIAFVLVLVNGFFVSAEFALVKVRRSRLKKLSSTGQTFAGTSLWLLDRMDASLSACQLGITMASLGLGWIGEPAIAHLIRPVLVSAGIASEMLIHGIAFTIAFVLITAAHLVLGEQAPKIAAIRNPETAVLWSAWPLKLFYYLSYPFLVGLSSATSFLLRKFGIEGSSEHEMPHSEEEIRALIRQSHVDGQLTRSELRLISAVFDFDELICRQVMLPRIDVVWADAGSSLAEFIALAEKNKYSRYPVCEGSMDKVVGVIHIKDLIWVAPGAAFDIRSIMRPPQFVPETLPLRRLLRRFQSTRQHMAFLVDEYGTVTGMLTLENVLELIVGSLEDEFDDELPDVYPEGPRQFVISGGMPVEILNRRFGLQLDTEDVDTIAGLLLMKADRMLVPGDRFDLPGVQATVVEVKDHRATRIRLKLAKTPPPQE
jgi:CBS domain containing-hemolysin-like protein